MGPGTKRAQLPEAPLLPKREAGSGWDGRGNDQGQSCSSNSFLRDSDPPSERRRGKESAQGVRDLLTATGAGSWKEVKWVWEAKGGFSWSTGDAHEWPSKAVCPPLATPRPSALTNVLNSGIAPRGPWPRH